MGGSSEDKIFGEEVGIWGTGSVYGAQIIVRYTEDTVGEEIC